jgi:1-acyl-sn-glycerol-3-phosphate acyltransferase
MTPMPNAHGSVLVDETGETRIADEDATRRSSGRRRNAGDASSVQHPLMHRAVYGTMRTVARTMGRGWRLKIEGAEHLPTSGPVLLAANHVSFIDSPILMFCLSRPIRFLGKAEYMESWKTRHLFPALGMIPVPRGGRRGALTALRTAVDALKRGDAIGIYPEGTRSRDGMLHRGHTGLAWIALKAKATIVPVGIIGTEHIQPPGAKFPKLRGTCLVRIGEPISTERYDSRDRRAQRVLTDDVMFEISQLSGQRYIDEYAVSPDLEEAEG